MPERVSVGKIVVGAGETRRVIAPGMRFKTENYKLDAATVDEYERRGILRKPRDESVQIPEDTGPRAESEEGRVIENRSPRATDVTSDMPNRMDARRDGGDEPDEHAEAAEGEREEEADAPDETSVRRRRTRRTSSDLDL